MSPEDDYTTRFIVDSTGGSLPGWPKASEPGCVESLLEVTDL